MKQLPTTVRVKDQAYLQKLLDPRFVERDGCIFFDGHFTDENFDAHWRDRARRDPRGVERTINHVHLDELADEPTEQQALGERIRDAWNKALASAFPGRDFTVRLVHANGDKSDWMLDLESASDTTSADRQLIREELNQLDRFHQKVAALVGADDYSALEVAVADLYGAYRSIYDEFIPAFLNAPDRRAAADALTDLLVEFNHIAWHIHQTEEALPRLIKVLDGETQLAPELRPAAHALRERPAAYATRKPNKSQRRKPAQRTTTRAKARRAAKK